jgi:DNA mismatch endonuclease (patch repair protein)
MARIGGRDTKPELLLRSALHRRGYRFRVNDRRYPGSPDIVLPRYGAVIFVHGCFWHAHDCALGVLPATRTEFWADKFARNRARDARVRETLETSGWRVLEVWECAWRGAGSRSHDEVVDEAVTWLENQSKSREISSV